jgi:CheY-like chemotaxis protein/anti-sigma regulatory factor (Ser/Thr protein kinase)
MDAQKNNARKNLKILVVDDEPEIRSILSDFLGCDEGYTVFTAQNGRDALDNVLSSTQIDLVLSDINMPVMKGFELLSEVRKLYPSTRRVLITAYNVEDYIEMAYRHDIGNIFVKSTPFNFQELSAMIDTLLTGGIFGLSRYFGPDCMRSEILIKRGDSIDTDVKQISALLHDTDPHRKTDLVLAEILTNAVFYGIRHENPERKDRWNFNFELDDTEAAAITVCRDSSKYAVSIADRGGLLKKKDVLYWLYRQSSHNETGAPLGVDDSHGRGLFIARRYIDRMIINIDAGKQTEIIIMNYTSDKYQGSKPLYINEI